MELNEIINEIEEQYKKERLDEIAPVLAAIGGGIAKGVQAVGKAAVKVGGAVAKGIGQAGKAIGGAVKKGTSVMDLDLGDEQLKNMKIDLLNTIKSGTDKNAMMNKYKMFMTSLENKQNRTPEEEAVLNQLKGTFSSAFQSLLSPAGAATQIGQTAQPGATT